MSDAMEMLRAEARRWRAQRGRIDLTVAEGQAARADAFDAAADEFDRLLSAYKSSVRGRRDLWARVAKLEGLLSECEGVLQWASGAFDTAERSAAWSDVGQLVATRRLLEPVLESVSAALRDGEGA